jgi:hypothetical protein
VDEPRATTLKRRLRAIVPLVVAFVVVTALLPVLVLVGLAVDLVRRIASSVPPTAARENIVCRVYITNRLCWINNNIGYFFFFNKDLCNLRIVTSPNFSRDNFCFFGSISITPFNYNWGYQSSNIF